MSTTVLLVALTIAEQTLNAKSVAWSDLVPLFNAILPAHKIPKTPGEFISAQLELLVILKFDLVHSFSVPLVLTFSLSLRPSDTSTSF